MTLPITDAMIVQWARIADALEEITGELVKINEREDNNLDVQVKDITEILETRYRQTIDNLEKRLPHDGHIFPVGGGLGKPPPRPPDNSQPV